MLCWVCITTIIFFFLLNLSSFLLLTPSVFSFTLFIFLFSLLPFSVLSSYSFFSSSFWLFFLYSSSSSSSSRISFLYLHLHLLPHLLLLLIPLLLLLLIFTIPALLSQWMRLYLQCVYCTSLVCYLFPFIVSSDYCVADRWAGSIIWTLSVTPLFCPNQSSREEEPSPGRRLTLRFAEAVAKCC